MAKWRLVAALAVALLIALGPSFAEARAGGSYRSGGSSSFTSQGSRGSHTYDAPMQRSVTPQGAAPGSQSPGYGAGYGGYHPFWTGLAGGLFGGWLGSMLFPHWGMGYGGGIGGGIGSIFLWLLIIWLVWMGFRAFSRRFHPATYPGGTTMGYSGLGGMFPSVGSGGGATASRGGPLAIAGADYQTFETILKHVQGAWSNGDIAGLRTYVTPEMLSYFAEELAGNQSQGVANHVEDVELVRGDLREAWDEGNLHYATCALGWRAKDYTTRLDRKPGDPDYVVAGDPNQPSEAAELWTFARSPGGHWLLSAIQQA